MSRFFVTTRPEMLYIHLPFCKHKCTYCDFVAIEGHTNYMEPYHRALCEEIRQFSAAINGPSVVIKTIFFGGGTPSIYPLDLFEELMALIRASFDLSGVKEVTLEINPGDLTEEHFRRWAAAGVTRGSIGVQVLSEKLLKRFNRHQSNADAAETVRCAARFFSAVSVDLIIGLPGVTEPLWDETLSTVLSWPLDHVSLYILTVHEHTRLYYGLAKGEMRLPPDAKLLMWYERTVERLKAADFVQYEISNFARAGRESLHNHGYWNRCFYKGFGLGAASYDGTYRFSNEKNLSTFIERYMTGTLSWDAVPFAEELTREQQVIEAVMLSLRRVTGLARSSLDQLFTPAQWEAFDRVVAQLKTAGFVREDEERRVILTQSGMLCENEVVAQLLAVL